uniref:Exostosin domain-containing protein n=1 Tax=Macrostomum lignano TaxID=282301 RepID=A0A1I8HM14_9PLAT
GLLAALCALTVWLGDCSSRCAAQPVSSSSTASPTTPPPLSGRALRLHRRNCADSLAALADLRRVKASVRQELVRMERERTKIMQQIRASRIELANLMRNQRKISADTEIARSDLAALQIRLAEADQRNLPVLRLPLNISTLKSASAVDKASEGNCGLVDCFDYARCGLADQRPRFALLYSATDSLTDAARLLNSSRRLLPDSMSTNVAVRDSCLVLADVGSSSKSTLSAVPAATNLVAMLLLPASAASERLRRGLIAERPRAVVASRYQPSGSYRPGWDIVMPAKAPFRSASDLWAALPPLVPARRPRLLAAPLLPGANSSWWRQISDVDRLVLDELQRLCRSDVVDNLTSKLELPALAGATFCPILAPAGAPLSTLGGQRRLLDCLLAGSVPLILGDMLPPFGDLLEPLWRRAIVRLPRSRSSELAWLLATYSDATLLELRRHGRLLLERHLGTWRAQAATLLTLLNRRLGLPGPAAVGPTGSSALLPGHSRLLMGRVPSHFDETQDYLGAVEPPLDSVLFQPRRQSASCRTRCSTIQACRAIRRRRQPTPNSTVPPTAIAPSIILWALVDSRRLLLSYNRESVLVGSLSKLAGLPYLHSVLVVWNGERPPNPSTVWPDLGGVPLHFIRGPGNSLNNRFLPWSQIRTEAVLSLDDDVYMRQDELVLAFRVWREHRDRIVGFPARFHARSGSGWVYDSNQTCEYSMVLTGAAFLHVHYLHLYSYWLPAALRAEVDRLTNCEDILMNFLVSHVTRKAPIKVTSRWTFPCFGCSQSLYKDDSHFFERSHCINYFSGMFGYNTLLYSQFRADSVLFKTRLGTDKVKCFKYV